MPNISINLFGFDFIPEDKNYQFWILALKNWDTEMHRCLFAFGVVNNTVCLDLLFIRLLGKDL